MNKKLYRVKVSEAGLGYYHAFKLWPEARPLSEEQQKIHNLFGFLIKHGGKVKPAKLYDVLGEESGVFMLQASIITAYKEIYSLKLPNHEAMSAIGVTSSFFNFLVLSGMLELVEATDG